MMSEQTFQPFTDRLSRDIRNDLSRSFVISLTEKSIQPTQLVADDYLSDDPAPCYRQYITSRLYRYQRCLIKITDGVRDPLYQGLVLWDERLFFEVHEILEHAWRQAEGKEKLFLQAMIRAAGVYIKIDSGYDTVAGRMAAKAIPVIKDNFERLSIYTAPEKLLKALATPGYPPPKLLQ